MCRLGSCGSWAQLLQGMWNLPGPGIEPMSPVLAGRFLSTSPPGKSFPPPRIFLAPPFPLVPWPQCSLVLSHVPPVGLPVFLLPPSGPQSWGEGAEGVLSGTWTRCCPSPPQPLAPITLKRESAVGLEALLLTYLHFLSPPHIRQWTTKCCSPSS